MVAVAAQRAQEAQPEALIAQEAHPNASDCALTLCALTL